VILLVLQNQGVGMWAGLEVKSLTLSGVDGRMGMNGLKNGLQSSLTECRI